MAETSKTPAARRAYAAAMSIDLLAAERFMARHARVLDRRRLQRQLAGSDAGAVLAALDAYRNPDGGYGWGLEPDLRSGESQPAGALHAFEALEDALPATTSRAAELCDWLGSVALPDGGLPFALPVADAAGCAPFWANADPAVSSLQITAYVAAACHCVAAADPAVAGHPWLAAATRYCIAAIAAIDEEPHALALSAALGLLDAVYDVEPDAAGLLDRLGSFIPADGLLHVGGGVEDELMRPLDFAPRPERPVRALFSDATIAAELRRLGDQQQDDGGWPVGFRSYSPAATLEWRGYMTVHALRILRQNGTI
jgi:hypothetical protein